MTAFLPNPSDLAAGLALLVALAAMLGVGRLACGRHCVPEVALVAGWGALCLLMTCWGVGYGHLTAPLGLFAVAALPGLRPLPRLGRVTLLSASLWVVLLAALPSQVDTWLNLLPNLAFLTDHARLPTDGGPASWSFLPAAPYNTQFVGFAVSALVGRLVPNALSLFNAALLCAAGLHVARVCAPAARQPPWWAAAAGLLLVMPLNPGFVPRVFLASYGEAPIAVALLFAVALGADLLLAARANSGERGGWLALALVLAALVEIKQSALGLLLPFALTLLVLGLVAPGIGRLRWAAGVAAATAPALGLYALYRWYVLAHFASGELKMLPVAAWHWALLPQILGGIAFAIFQKATYFAAVAACLVAAWWEARRRPWQRPAVVLALAAGLILGFNAFLLFTYVAHFPAVWAVRAHSYFRYMSQLSLAVVLGLTLWLRPGLASWVAGWPRRRRLLASGGAIGLAVCLPIGGVAMLRFDLAPPQPFLWSIGHETAARLQDGDRLAMLLPGDGDDAVGSLLRGVLLFTAPRRPHLDFRMALEATPPALAAALAAGFPNALVTCAKHGLAGIPPGQAGLLRYSDGAWHVRAVWPIPTAMARQHFSAMLPRTPFCLDGKTRAGAP